MKSTPRELEKQLNAILLGKPEIIRLLLAALIADGHILIEDVPGTGKTTLARALASSLSAQFRRIQFSPDLLPGDVVGGPIYDPQKGSFRLLKGPVFTEILLADEVNRAAPRTQSALLEAMEEGQVTLEGQSLALPKFFMVLATQNPLGFTGTHPLPEAQLDRFLLRLEIGYPDTDFEIQLLLSQDEPTPPSPIVSLESVFQWRQEANQVKLHPDLAKYMVELAQASRRHPSLKLGLSPRALLALLRMSKATAYLNGRDWIWPEDIQEVWLAVVCHRVLAADKHISITEVMTEILRTIPIPR